jgi:hypothetical protein
MLATIFMLATRIRTGYPSAMPKKTPGRPPAGLRKGEKASEYRRLTVRVPERTLRLVAQLAEREGRPQWRIVNDALDDYAARQREG